MRALLFDLGGTLWDDWPAELAYLETCAGLLSAAGQHCNLELMLAEVEDLVHRYTPSLNRAIVWKFSGRDAQLAARIRSEASRRIWERLEHDDDLARLYPLWPGVHDVLDELSGKLRLGVVSMHGSPVRGLLWRMGLLEYFSELALCDEAGFHKPDPRIVEHALGQLGTGPADCGMVGDRIDNDIWPANCLGLNTIWLRVPPYDVQQPRYELDQPDLMIDHIRELPAALQREGWL